MDKVEELKLYLLASIIICSSFASVILVVIYVTLMILIRKVRQGCHSIFRNIKQANKLIKEKLSPSVDDFLAVLKEIDMTEDKVKIFTIYDSRRRKAAEKQLQFHKPNIKRYPIFHAFLSESNFIKGAGFRMHRLLHEGRIQTFSDDDRGMTVLAPPFEPVKLPPMKVTSTEAMTPGATIAVSIPPTSKTSPQKQPSTLTPPSGTAVKSNK